MPAPRGGRGPGDRQPPRSVGKRTGRPTRAPIPRGVAQSFDAGLAVDPPRAFRPAPEYRSESTAGLRRELIQIRAEVQRLAAEIDKLWARERGRGLATPGRTARSIAGKPVRTGTRASRPGQRPAAPSSARTGAKRTGPPRGKPAGARPSGTPKRSTGAKRAAGWAKPKSRSRRAGTTPRRKGR